MRNQIIALSVALCGALTPAQAQEEKPADTSGPTWIERPTPDLFDQYYPPFAMYQNVVGRVVLDCTVLANSSHTCTIEQETAPGWDFGEAAIAISHSFRFEAAQRNGRAIASRLRVPVTFRFPHERYPSPYDDLVDENQPAFSHPPIWEEAPNFLAVMRVYPQAAFREQVRGRALLSCLVNSERRLDCRSEMEMPANRGFGDAALQLSRQFRVSETDTEALARYRDERLLLPINFGPSRELTPVPPLTGGAPLVLTLPVPIDAPFYPAPARFAAVGGVADVLCTYGANTSCVLEREDPDIWRFGDAALEMANTFPYESLADYMAVIDGDQLRFQFRFFTN